MGASWAAGGGGGGGGTLLQLILQLVLHLLHQVPGPQGRLLQGFTHGGAVLGRCRLVPGSSLAAHLAHGLHGGKGGLLHFQSLNGHLQHGEVHAQPTFHGLQVGDPFFQFIGIEGGGHHAGQGKTHVAPHLPHEFHGVGGLLVGHLMLLI